jgi:hypothetical protein
MDLGKQLMAAISRGLVGLLLSLLVTGCAKKMEVYSAYGPGMQFSGIGSTYDWLPVKKEDSGDPHADNPHLHKLVRETVETHLAASGFTRTASGTPDFWIDYGIAREEKGDLVGQTYVYHEGSLILRVVNPETGKLVWHGSARAKMDKSLPPAQREQRINMAVERLVERFPASGD